METLENGLENWGRTRTKGVIEAGLNNGLVAENLCGVEKRGC